MQSEHISSNLQQEAQLSQRDCATLEPVDVLSTAVQLCDKKLN